MSPTTKKAKQTKSSKAGLLLPVERVRQQLMNGNYANRIQTGSAVYMAAALQYLCAEILDIAKNEAVTAKKQRITQRHIMLAIRNDGELDQLLKNVTIPEAGILPTVSLPKPSKTHQSEEL